MDNSGKPNVVNDLVTKGQSLADRAADKVQGGIHSAQQAANSAASSASDKVESLRSGTKQSLENAASRASGILDKVGGTQDSIVTYTQEKPVKALLIAAAAGAILVTLIRALSGSRGDS